MTSSHTRAGARWGTTGRALADLEDSSGAADAASALVAYLERVDDRFQERVLVLAHVHGVDAAELFALTRADLWARREEFAASDESERLTVTWLLLARHARTMAKRAEGRSVPPVDHAAVDAARALPPPWRHLPGPVLLADPQTAVFRALAHLGEPARSVLLLHWLGVGADDVADELRLGEDAVARLRHDARTYLHRAVEGAGPTHPGPTHPSPTRSGGPARGSRR